MPLDGSSMFRKWIKSGAAAAPSTEDGAASLGRCSPVPAGGAASVGSRASKGAHDASESAEALQSQLEKLEEECQKIKHQLARVHNHAELSIEVVDEDLTLTRSRFSRAAPGATPAGSLMPSKEGSIKRGAGARGASAGGGRSTAGGVASSLNSSSIASMSSFGPRMSYAVRPAPSPGAAASHAPTSAKDLLAMVQRGRKRAQYNSRVDSEELAALTGNGAVTLLPRGGVHVRTRHGPVQFGIPPETIKDSLQLGLDVPKVYVVGKERFNLKFGTNTAEFEFPAYWNFFIKGDKTTVVCAAAAAAVIRQVMEEVLEGPAEEHLHQDDEYSPFVDDSIYAARPDLLREIGYFKEPRNGRKIEADTLLQFVEFACSEELPAGHLLARMAFDDGTIEVIDRGAEYDVIVDDELVATVPDWLSSAIADPPHILMPMATAVGDAIDFEAPQFGITVLGAADGFTAAGTTAGFILWMRGRGILVDPPAHSAHYLRRNGISSRKITHVILTHCHADHDAGTFQKILLEQRVTVLTTRTIMAAFVRKYALISEMNYDFLQRLFCFHSVKIGEPVHFQGGSIKFFYSLHALPCIGFRAELAGKSIVYSSDTYYDPDGLAALQQRGIISAERCASLCTDCSVQQADLLLHEAGIAPIHTPFDALAKLPDNIKRSIRVIHCNDARAAESEFEKVQPGFEHTITIDTEPPLHAEANQILQILLVTDIFRKFDVESIVDVLSVITTRSYSAGEPICKAGDEGRFLRIVKAGIVMYERDGARPFELRYCDYFGEGELLTDATHAASATAATRVEVLEIERGDVQYLFRRRPNLMARIQQRAKLSYDASWAAIGANSVFSGFSMAQVTQLQSVMRQHEVGEGEVIWRKGDEVLDVVLVGDARLAYRELADVRGATREDLEPFGPGALLVNVYALENRLRHELTLTAERAGTIFHVIGEDLLDFLDNNPGAFIWMRDTLVVC